MFRADTNLLFSLYTDFGQCVGFYLSLACHRMKQRQWLLLMVPFHGNQFRTGFIYITDVYVYAWRMDAFNWQHAFSLGFAGQH